MLQCEPKATMLNDRSVPRPIRESWAYAILLLKTQFVLVFAVSVGSALFSWTAAYSAAIGGSIALIGQAYFTLRAFRYAGARQMKAVVHSFYAGAAGKWLITSLLFASALIYVPELNSLVMFIAFGVTLSASFIAPLVKSQS